MYVFYDIFSIKVGALSFKIKTCFIGGEFNSNISMFTPPSPNIEIPEWCFCMGTDKLMTDYLFLHFSGQLVDFNSTDLSAGK